MLLSEQSRDLPSCRMLFCVTQPSLLLIAFGATVSQWSLVRSTYCTSVCMYSYSRHGGPIMHVPAMVGCARYAHAGGVAGGEALEGAGCIAHPWRRSFFLTS